MGMDIPILFALYATNDVNIWSKLINRSLVHKTYGSGKIEKIEKEDEQIIITCKFEDNVNNEGFENFSSKAFEQGSFAKLELLFDFDKYLVENENRLIKKYLDREDELRGKRYIAKVKTYEVEDANRKISRNSYINICHSCKSTITDMMKKCSSCGWYICDSCESCGCNYGNNKSLE